ncbi:MAG: hypothetical protein ACREHF_15270 [Rhizomicrobium sp.]
MEVQWFLEERTTFLRYYYDSAAAPFLEIHRKIEAGEPPYKSSGTDPDAGASDEPPYMEEWSDAANALNFLGRSCISMLSGSMQLYFEAWKQELRIELDDTDRRVFSNNGILFGYRDIFEQLLKVPWKDCPADLTVLEQVTLARNNDQHPQTITSLDAYHQKRDWKKHPDLFFISDRDRRALAEQPDSDALFTFANRVEVTRDKLFKAINELEQLAGWLEPQLMTLRYGNTTGFPVRE